jgi:hypothetical protein
MRGVSIAAALTAAGTWALLPLREQLARITHVRVTSLTSAVLLFCVVVTVITVTRRTTSGIQDIESRRSPLRMFRGLCGAARAR